MNKINKYIFALLLFSVLIIASCTNNQKSDKEKDTASYQSKTPKGITLTPKSFGQEEFTYFFEKSRNFNIVAWYGDWNELSNLEKGGPVVVNGLSSKYDYMPLIIVQFFTQDNGKLLRPLDETTIDNYKNYLGNFAEKYKPEYLGIGIEINVLYEKSPADFERFVKLFDESYDLIKTKSPDTKVFTVFQLEKMKGLNGGLFGGTNDQTKNQWSLIGQFQKSDIIAFTTYPDLVYKNPEEIPADYYDEIKMYASKPIVFTEIGWHTANSPKGWESSEDEQAEFVKKFFDLTKDLNKEFIIWSFMYDQKTIEPFNSMGLIDSNTGNDKKSFNEWAN
ncbi:MAG: hypothetical protein AABW41_00250 [Nanoarchaeota archaeon]